MQKISFFLPLLFIIYIFVKLTAIDDILYDIYIEVRYRSWIQSSKTGILPKHLQYSNSIKNITK